MADGIELAKAFVQIVPTTKGIKGQIADELSEGDPGADAGNKIGSSLKKAIAAVGIGSAVVKGLQMAADTVKQSISAFADYEQLTGGIETLFGNAKIGFDDFAKQADNAGKSLKQLVNDYDAMDSAQETVFKNAHNAFKTAGLSANEYMETVTGFSAALINSLGGDTVAAASLADLAITDMSDNANKMGTSMESIQNAYAGFSRGNYTMLDNLSLGFAGTKEGMQQLLDKAKEISGVEYSMDSYADIVNAIHVVQTEMGITGTTAKEAATTISGSFGMLSASWQNMLVAMSDSNADFGQAIDDLIESAGAVADNLIPVLGTAVGGLGKTIAGLIPKIVEQLPGLIEQILTELVPALGELAGTLPATLIDAISELIPILIPFAIQLLEALIFGIIDNLDMLIESALGLVEALGQGIIEALPELVKMLPELITAIVDFIYSDLPTFINSAIEIVLALAMGLIEAIPDLIAVLPDIIDALVTGILDNLPLFLDSGIEIIMALIEGIVEMLPEILFQAGEAILTFIGGLAEKLGEIPEKGKEMIDKVKEGIMEKIEDAKTWGKDLIDKFVNGIKEKWEHLKQSVTKVADTIKGLLGFSEPKEGPLHNFHTYAPDMMNLFASGVEANTPMLRATVAHAFDFQPVIGEAYTPSVYNAVSATATQTATPTQTNSTDDDRLLRAFENALENVTVTMDGKQMGRFVVKTVTKEVYA